MRRTLRALIALSMLAALVSTGSAATPGGETDTYIVVLKPQVADVPATAAELAKVHDGQLGFVYEHALRGFSVQLSARAAGALARNPLVAYVEADQVIQIAAQEVPTGVERIFADDNSEIDIDGSDDFRVDVDIAIIDTGIDLDHPDLNVVASTNCSGGGPFKQSCGSGGNDDNGHGTHVAGSAAALDNGVGVVGVAPGARLWAVKVLNSNGSGYISWIVAGIDYVTANAAAIEVANMSLGCECASSAMDTAIANSVDAGVAYAVAAGNSDKDAATFSPANHPDVLTVSALADFDGDPGGSVGTTTSPPYCRVDQDDTLADFSNWGSRVEIAAPGVCILSTWNDGGYNTISGTSMASPHGAGALALLASANNPSNQTGVQGLYDTLEASGNLNWTDDSGDGIKERLLDVSNSTVFNPALVAGGGGGGTDNPPTVSITNPSDGATVSGAVTVSADATDDVGVSQVEFFVDGASIGVDSDGLNGWSVSWDTTTVTDGGHTVRATATDTAAQTASDSHSVTVDNSGGGGGGLTLTGSSTNNGSSWTATVTVDGADSGQVISGTWNIGGTAEQSGCTVPSGGTSCSFSRSGIAKRVSSATWTGGNNEGSVTINKP